MTAKPYNEEFGLPLPGFLHTDCPHYWRYGQNKESESDGVRQLNSNFRGEYTGF